jgi:uncharacterized membrane protein YphA (DoxX/SURF4 family)
MVVPNHDLIRFAIAALYLAVFVEASLGKFAERATPEWFAEKFKPTFLGRIPASLLWWPIAIGEFVVAVAFAAAAVALWLDNPISSALFSLGLFLATLLFSALCFGLRVTQDYPGAASAFTYGALSVVLWIGLV